MVSSKRTLYLHNAEVLHLISLVIALFGALCVCTHCLDVNVSVLITDATIWARDVPYMVFLVCMTVVKREIWRS